MEGACSAARYPVVNPARVGQRGSLRAMLDPIDAVLERLDEVIRRSRERRSRQGYFAALYRRVTATIREKIGTGFFDDDDRLARLDVVFANRYLGALAQFERGDQNMTRAWRVAFEAAERPDLTVMQHLLLGINPHMNIDLAVASSQVVGQGPLASLREDFERINTLLRGLVPIVEREVGALSPVVALANRFFGVEEAAAMDVGIFLGRESAWSFAEALSKAAPGEVAAQIDARDVAVTRIGNALADPGPLLAEIVHLATAKDVVDVVEVIDTLSARPSGR
jgi:hypothetical protein